MRYSPSGIVKISQAVRVVIEKNQNVKSEAISNMLRDKHKIDIEVRRLSQFIRMYVREAEKKRKNGYNYYTIKKVKINV